MSRIFSLTALPNEKKGLRKSKSAPNLAKEKKNVVAIPNGKTLADSPRTKEACKKLGITRKDLLPKSLDQFKSPGIKPQIQRLRFEFHEKHRQELVKRVRSERKKIISKGWDSARKVGLSPQKLEKIIMGEETYVQQKMQAKRKKLLAHRFNEELEGFNRRVRGQSKVVEETKILQKIKKKRTEFAKHHRKLSRAKSIQVDQNLELQEKRELVRMKSMMEEFESRDKKVQSLKSSTLERKKKPSEFQIRQKKRAKELERERREWENEKRRKFVEKERQSQKNKQRRQNSIKQKQAEKNKEKMQKMKKLQEKRLKMKQMRERKLDQQISQVQARIHEIERKKEKRKRDMKAASKVDDRKRAVEAKWLKERKERESKFEQKEREAAERLKQLEEERLLEQEMKKEENRLNEERQKLAKLQKQRAENYKLDKLQEKIEADTTKYKTRKQILSKISQERRIINEQGALARAELKYTLSHAGEDVLGNPHKLASITSKLPQRFAIDYAPPKLDSSDV